MSLDVKDLRIGNHVLINQVITIVDSIGPDWINIEICQGDEFFDYREGHPYIGNRTPDVLEGILLTEEWLLKAGFIKYDLDIFHLHNKEHGTIELSILNQGDHWRPDFYYNSLIKYVHQLQNLYFALTGKKLEFKDIEK